MIYSFLTKYVCTQNSCVSVQFSVSNCFLIPCSKAKISALKELVRQSEEDQSKNAVSAQEKVKNIAQRLTHLKSKATRSRQIGKIFIN